MTAEEHTLTPEELEEQQVYQEFRKLLDAYLASNHRKKVDIITRAFNFAKQAHKGVRRRSGEPYIMHPIAVARIACEEIGLGSTSICAALLHDVVEDTEYTFEDIQNLFGTKIASIVEGLTKIAGGIFGERASLQAETFKKLLLTMSEDIRVILIKISDRLHNMRTLSSMQPSKQYKIAGETLYIYAPIASRLGLNRIKNELEDLSFKYEHPDDYQLIQDKLASTQAERDFVFREFTTPIRTALDGLGLTYTIEARIKTPYSIWKKMQDKHVTFEEIFDILATRIIFEPKQGEDEVNTCFNIYVALTKIYTLHPDRTRDWVNHPKANGYQALHVTLMSRTGQWIEVQIRSDRMDEIAEQGFAAHWKYKEHDQEGEEDSELNDWLRTIKEILDDPQPDAMDFLDTIKLNLFASEIFVFTPKGEIKTMPANCTALDFAFTIHTFLGSHCIGAKVNHKLVPMSHKLKSGDQVEILTSKSQHPKPEWINFVCTAKAKGKIQAILRRDNKEVQRKGEEILRQWLKDNDMTPATSIIDKLCAFHDMLKPESFFQALGERSIILGDKDLDELLGKKKKTSSSSGGWRKFVPFLKSKEKAAVKPDLLVVGRDFNRKIPCVITEDTIGMYIFPDCCHPIPGDDILGFINSKNQVEIHKRVCSVATKFKSSFGNRILDAKWDMHKRLFFDAVIEIRGIDRKAMLYDVSKVLSKDLDVNIHKLTISADQGIFVGTVEIRVHDRDEVVMIMKRLKTIDDLQEVSQIM